MGRASDAPVVASAGTQAEPRTPASWLLSADRSQTAAPLPVGSDPRSVRRTEPFHKAPLPSSPALGRYASCRNFTPAQPDRPAASMRDFCSGAYMLVRRSESSVGGPPIGADQDPASREINKRAQCFELDYGWVPSRTPKHSLRFREGSLFVRLLQISGGGRVLLADDHHGK